jgi:hypothetical protein
MEKLISFPENITNWESFGMDPGIWQGDSSRIIRYEGKYHVWMIDGFNYFRDGESWVLHLTSEDCRNWTAEKRLPLGPEGSAYDVAIEQPNVVYHEGSFYLFSEGWTSNTEKYGSRYAGIICLRAERPEGPWVQVGNDPVLAPSLREKSWESSRILNPRHVYFKGKWFMYYKGKAGGRVPWHSTQNGVAIADHITGPYKRYEKNPLMQGHGHFAFTYKHGIVYIPFAASRIYWSEDGVTFSENLCEDPSQIFLCGSIYVPGNPQFGAEHADPDYPVGNEYLGFLNLKGDVNGKKVNNMDTIRWSFGMGTEGEYR